MQTFLKLAHFTSIYTSFINAYLEVKRTGPFFLLTKTKPFFCRAEQASISDLIWALT